MFEPSKKDGRFLCEQSCVDCCANLSHAAKWYSHSRWPRTWPAGSGEVRNRRIFKYRPVILEVATTLPIGIFPKGSCRHTTACLVCRHASFDKVTAFGLRQGVLRHHNGIRSQSAVFRSQPLQVRKRRLSVMPWESGESSAWQSFPGTANQRSINDLWP